MHPNTSRSSAGGAYGRQDFESFIITARSGDIRRFFVRRQLGRPGATRLLIAILFERYADHARVDHAERAGGTDRDIDDATANEGSAIVDAALDRTAVVRNLDDAAEWARAMRAGHFALTAIPAIMGSQSGFSLRACSCSKRCHH